MDEAVQVTFGIEPGRMQPGTYLERVEFLIVVGDVQPSVMRDWFQDRISQHAGL